MKRHLPLVAATVAILTAATAHAQRRDRRDDDRPSEQMGVESWEPKTGPVGTVVEIRGYGFTRQTRVLLGGKPIRPKRLVTKSITFVIPSDYGDGSIVLRDAGAYRDSDLVVGSYRVMVPPVFRRMKPMSGGYGSRVELYGDFDQGDRVLINNREIPVASYGRGRIVVEIPDWATTDWVYVRRDGYDEVRSPAKFQVLSPKPEITRISPDYGPPGTTVRIEGRWFGDRDRVFWGRLPVRALSRGKDWVEVRVPDRAKGSQAFAIRSQYGEGLSREFRLEFPSPTLSEWGPQTGDYGTKVVLRGTNFDDSCNVFYGNRKLRVSRRDANSIEVLVPDGVEDDYFVVRSRYGEVKTGKPFQVAASPKLGGFMPRNGRPGDRIRLAGRNFNKRMRVLVGTWPANVVEWNRQWVEVEVPREATAGSYDIWVEDGNYRDRDDKQFVVEGYCTFDGWDRDYAERGEVVEIRGSGYNKNVRAYFGDKEIPVRRFTPKKIWVLLDDVAGTDWIYLDDGGHKVRSPQKFEIRPKVRVIDKRRKNY